MSPSRNAHLAKEGKLSASAVPHRAMKETQLSTSADPHRVAPRSCAPTELPSSCSASFVGPSAERTIEGRSDEARNQEIIAIIASDFMGLEIGPRNRSNGVGKRHA